MKYKYVKKVFENKNDIDIPDDAIGVYAVNPKFIRYNTTIKHVFGVPVDTYEEVWGLEIEWLEPVK